MEERLAELVEKGAKLEKDGRFQKQTRVEKPRQGWKNSVNVERETFNKLRCCKKLHANHEKTVCAKHEDCADYRPFFHSTTRTSSSINTHPRECVEFVGLRGKRDEDQRR